MTETKKADLGEFLTSKKLQEDAKKANQEKTAATSRRKLENVIQKKCQTTMIGALARFEEKFGHLWGHGKPPQELSEEEKAWREAWDVARTEVLNNGNNQLRAIKEELARYVVNYEGYQIKMPVKSITVTGETNEEQGDE